MQIYISRTGSRYFVIDGDVYYSSGGVIHRSLLMPEEMVQCIRDGDLEFSALTTPRGYMLMREHVKTL